MPINTNALKDSIEGKPRRKSGNQSDRHSSFAQNAESLALDKQKEMATGQRNQLEKLTSALERAEQRRGDALEVLSDRLAYLQDERIFLKDLLELAEQKKRRDSDPSDALEEVEILESAIDDLASGFDAAYQWQYPAIAPTSAAGALPVY